MINKMSNTFGQGCVNKRTKGFQDWLQSRVIIFMQYFRNHACRNRYHCADVIF